MDNGIQRLDKEKKFDYLTNQIPHRFMLMTAFISLEHIVKPPCGLIIRVLDTSLVELSLINARILLELMGFKIDLTGKRDGQKRKDSVLMCSDFNIYKLTKSTKYTEVSAFLNQHNLPPILDRRELNGEDRTFLDTLRDRANNVAAHEKDDVSPWDSSLPLERAKIMTDQINKLIYKPLTQKTILENIFQPEQSALWGDLDDDQRNQFKQHSFIDEKMKSNLKGSLSD